jgi:hypothetical protein
VTPNDLRRTFATWQAEAGVPELVTAALMGHTTSAMVRKVYAKIGDQAKRDALARLPGLIGSSVTELPGRKRTARRNRVRAVDSTVTDVVTNRVKNRGDNGQKSARIRTVKRDRKQKPREKRGSSVPRDRIELSTPGFSVPVLLWPRPRKYKVSRQRASRTAAYLQHQAASAAVVGVTRPGTQGRW